MDHRQPIKTRVFSTALLLPLIVATGCLATSATQGNTSSTVELSTTASPERQKQGLAIATALRTG